MKLPESNSAKVGIAILSIIAAILIIMFGVWLSDVVPKVGIAASTTPLSLPEWLASWVVADGSPQVTLEALIIFFAIFIVMIFAMADILEVFSTFSPVTCWVISLALGLIAAVTKIIGLIAGMLGIAAGIGALGIIVIALSAVFAAVSLNLGLGGAARRWRLQRQVEIDSLKSARGTGKVAAAIKGLKDVEKAFKDGEIS